MRPMALAAATLLAVSLGDVSAANITIPTVSSNWHDTLGGTNVVENVSFGRVDADPGDGFNQARWGEPGTSATSGRSGLGFQGLAPLSGIAINTAFQIGELRHYNWTLRLGTGASSSQLDLSAALEIDGVGSPGSPYNFTTALTIDETPNSEPCAYPSATPCSDRITFEQVGTSDTFTIDGVEYTFQVIGFGPTPDALIDEFISKEGGDSTTPLWARITQATHPVSEPGSFVLLTAVLGMLAGIRRRSNR